MTNVIGIVGPTATGKTKLALSYAQETESVLISADSRQVYRGMDIVTGKDHPSGTKVYGINLVDPDQPISVSVWYDAVMPVIQDGINAGKQVIIVGGTGLYLRALTHGIGTLRVPINANLRQKLSTLSLTELQSNLTKLNREKYLSFNHSDQNNPRRLIRAIEVAEYNNSSDFQHSAFNFPLTHSARLIGLRFHDLESQQQKIKERVLDRLDHGALDETRTLLQKYPSTIQSMTAIGYRSLVAYLKNELSYDGVVVQWVKDELAYAKRQLTWFNKQEVTWYDIT